MKKQALAIAIAATLVTVTACDRQQAKPTVTHTVTVPGPTVTKVRIQRVISEVNRPPYWRVKAPSWCQEDMLCWIGSEHDSRSDDAVMRDWNAQMHINVSDYGFKDPNRNHFK